MRFIFLLSLSLSSYFLTAQDLKTFKTWYDPVAKTKVHEVYTTLPTSPYLKQGSYKEYDEHGYLLKDYTFTNGKLNGVSKNYFGMALASVYDNSKCYLGKVFTQTIYKNDTPSGQEIMYDYVGCVQHKLKENTWENGVQIKTVSYYDNGVKKEELVLNGACTSYYPNGKLESKYTKVNGYPHGVALEYYPDGTLSARSKYINGKEVDTLFLYYRSGSLKSYSIHDGESNLSSKSEEYATNGKQKVLKTKQDQYTLTVTEYDTLTSAIAAKYIEKYSNSERKLITVGRYEIYEDGKLRVTKSFDSEGKQDGPFVMYDIKGDTVVAGLMRNGRCHGEWFFSFDEDWEHPKDYDSAAYFRIANFQNGVILGTVKDYYLDQSLQWEGKLISMYPDVIDGPCIYYYPNGNKLEEGSYNRGTKIGEWKIYNEDGSLDKTETY